MTPPRRLTRPLGLSTSQAARELGVSLGTVRRWATMGYLRSYRSPGGQLRFSIEEIEQFRRSLQAEHTRGAPRVPIEVGIFTQEEVADAADAAEVDLLRRLAEEEAAIIVRHEALEGDPTALMASLEQLIERLTPVDPPVPSEAALVAARRNAQARWDLLEETGHLTAEQIAETRSQAKNRAAYASRLRRQRRLFAVPWHGRTLFPAFQFDPTSGEPRPVVADVLAVLPIDEMTEWEAALWWSAANGWIHGGERPLDWIDRDPALVVEAAAHERDRPPA